ncbi:MAG: hypothetical protein WC683_17510 [bacterium]
MRKLLILTALATLCLALAGAEAGAAKSGGSKKSLKIQVREVQVKSAPNYLASSVGTLGYGAPVSVQSEDGNWYRISSPAGFIPKNATGKNTGSVESGERYAAKGVTHDETALAGKGFNPAVEGQYKSSSASLAQAYGQVDRVEAIRISEGELSSFITQGKLNK